jgi:hypothetical protein
VAAVENGLLIAGYTMAVPPLLAIRRVVRARNALLYFGGIELGTALVATGWALKGNSRGAAINAAGCVVLPLWWAYTGRRARKAGER